MVRLVVWGRGKIKASSFCLFFFFLIPKLSWRLYGVLGAGWVSEWFRDTLCTLKSPRSTSQDPGQPHHQGSLPWAPGNNTQVRIIWGRAEPHKVRMEYSLSPCLMLFRAFPTAINLETLTFWKPPLTGLCKTCTYFLLEKFPSTRATWRDPVDLNHYLSACKLVRIYLAIEK